MGFSPASTHGGSGLPAPWTAGAHGNVLATNDDGSVVPLTIKGGPGQGTSLFEVQTEDGDDVLVLDETGGLHYQFFVTAGGDLRADLSIGLGTVSLDLYGPGATFQSALALTAAGLEAVFNAATGTRSTQNGLVIIGTHAAPADGDLAAGECCLWFDQTDGVGNTKLKAKGKSADGTVKTATLLLA